MFATAFPGFSAWFLRDALNTLHTIFRRMPPRHAGPDARARALETRARRDFLLDQIDRHPQALTSAYDLETLMQIYPGRI